MTVRIYGINQHKVVTEFLDMCLSKSATSAGVIPWSNCIAFGVDNTSVNVGRHKFLIIEARKKNEHIVLMGCPCHIVCNHLLEYFDVEELLVDIYFHLDYSSKRKNLLAEFNSLCDQNYCNIIKFHCVDCLPVLKEL